MAEERIRNYTKFFTPSEKAAYLVSLINIEIGDVILEPSAGNGAIVRAIKNRNAGAIVFAFEINEDYEICLKNAGANVVVIKDFLEIPDLAKFTSCIANPPFGNGIDLQAHFDKICLCVGKGGEIAMIVPSSFTPTVEHKTYAIENWSSNSDGTTTEIKIIHFINP